MHNKFNSKFNFYYLKCNLKYFCKINASLIVFSAITLIAAIALGVFVAIMIGENHTGLNVFEALKNAEYSYVSTFLIYLFFAFILILLSFFSVIKRCFAVMAFMWLFFIGYRLGLNLTGAIFVSLPNGILSLVFFYIPLSVCYIMLNSTSIAVASKYWIAKGASLTCQSSLTKVATKLCLVLLTFLFFALCFCVIIPWLFSALFL